jgi:hypothetical protein
MKNGFLLSAVLCILMFSVSSEASWTMSSKCQIGQEYYMTSGGKLSNVQFNLYNYVGGTYVSYLFLTPSNGNTGDLTAYGDLVNYKNLLERTYTNYDYVYYVANSSGSTTGYIKTGDQCWIEVGK